MAKGKKTEEPQNEDVMFETMPGADKLSEDSEQSLDMNFGLGEEEKEEETEVEETTAEKAEEETTEEPEVEETVEEPEEEVAEETQEETVAETEETPAEEEEAKAEEPEPEPEPEPQAKKPMVPKSRLDEVLAKQKALQKQLDEAKAAQTPAENAPEEYNFDEKEVEYQNLVLDGEASKAAALRQEIRQAERTRLEYELTQKVTQTVHQSQQATALQTAANELAEKFSVFDENSADYNAEYTQEVIDLRDAFVVQGYDVVDALSKASNFVVKSYDLVAPVEETGSTLTKTTAPKAKPVDEVAKKRAEVNKKLKAAESQPPELPGESSAARGEKVIDVTNMTEEEFDALPAATLARLRGDII